MYIYFQSLIARKNFILTEFLLPSCVQNKLVFEGSISFVISTVLRRKTKQNKT